MSLWLEQNKGTDASRRSTFNKGKNLIFRDMQIKLLLSDNFSFNLVCASQLAEVFFFANLFFFGCESLCHRLSISFLFLFNYIYEC